ncbi:ATP synthase gamma chain [Cavenderia fasciculata]|uniref:F-ATPase gamma subunit n=1 Tax=Cavenderia fasciculata TaxID=261658 RepID=F4Q212_CACFS|nr:ATP synthase gamma chain [Cavenderia fasciculata]EGG18032.1 ATP synthase gamma chain [Cavenderia fasciculata]|eukprot:XP_004356925.1 ATP synthase gamma chain [Cavenderia fasciculata]
MNHLSTLLLKEIIGYLDDDIDTICFMLSSKRLYNLLSKNSLEFKNLVYINKPKKFRSKFIFNQSTRLQLYNNNSKILSLSSSSSSFKNQSYLIENENKLVDHSYGFNNATRLLPPTLTYLSVTNEIMYSFKVGFLPLSLQTLKMKQLLFHWNSQCLPPHILSLYIRILKPPSTLPQSLRKLSLRYYEEERDPFLPTLPTQLETVKLNSTPYYIDTIESLPKLTKLKLIESDEFAIHIGPNHNLPNTLVTIVLKFHKLFSKGSLIGLNQHNLPNLKHLVIKRLKQINQVIDLFQNENEREEGATCIIASQLSSLHLQIKKSHRDNDNVDDIGHQSIPLKSIVHLNNLIISGRGFKFNLGIRKSIDSNGRCTTIYIYDKYSLSGVVVYQKMNRTVITTTTLFMRQPCAQQQRNMATLKELKNRLGTVKTISKLTKTLNMVASSRLRSAEKKAEELGVYSLGPNKLVSEITNLEGFGEIENTGESRSHKNLVIGVTTDTGMCGPVNHQVVRAIKGMLADNQAQNSTEQLVVTMTGLKGVAPITSAYPKALHSSSRDFGKSDFSFPETCVYLSKVVKDVPNFDSATVVYNKFKNAMSYAVSSTFVPGFNLLEHHREKFYAYQTNEDRSATMKDFSEFNLISTLWGSLYQNRASETAARMISMDNASKNGEQISAALSIQYNRARQAMITGELIEITSGAAAISESA